MYCRYERQAREPRSQQASNKFHAANNSVVAHLDDNSVVRVLGVYYLCALRSDLAALLALDKGLVEQVVGSDHIVHDASLTDFFGPELTWCREIRAIVVT